MTEKDIVSNLSILVGLMWLVLICQYVLTKRNVKNKREEEDQNQVELINEMITSSKEFVPGEVIPFSNQSLFGGFQSNNKMLILVPNSLGDYSQQFFMVKVGMEIVLGYNTFIVQGLNHDNNKISLGLKYETAA